MQNQWTEAAPKAAPEPPIYLNLTPGQSAVIRPVGPPVRYWKWWQPVSAISPGPGVDPCWRDGRTPQSRWATWVLDRADGKLKIISLPDTAASSIGEWAARTSENPGGVRGIDWRCEVLDCDGQTVWRVTMASSTSTVSPSEIEMMRPVLAVWRLKELYKPDTPERITELMEFARQNPDGPPPGSWKWRQEQNMAPRPQSTVKETRA